MKLAEQAREFRPAAVVIANEQHYEALKALLADCPEVKVYAGAKALDEIVEAQPIDMVLTAMVGYAGLSPTIHAIKARKTICLANKETLVVAGELICQLANEYRVNILPVDSEHSAESGGRGSQRNRQDIADSIGRSLPQVHSRTNARR